MKNNKVIIFAVIVVAIVLVAVSFYLGKAVGRSDVYSEANSTFQNEITKLNPGVSCNSYSISSKAVLDSVIKSAVNGEQVECPSPTYL